MPTKLTRPVTRETSARYQGRTLIVRLEEGGKLVRIRQKGLRTWHTATVEQLWWAAVKNTAAELKAIKQARRLERRKAKGMAR